MNSKKKLLAALIAFCVLLQLQIPVFAISGTDFTTGILAERLQNIMEGHVGLYADAACQEEVVLPLGSRYDSQTKYWIRHGTTGKTLYGWQCYIYGNAAYNALFDEWVGHGNALMHSERLNIPAGIDQLTYLRFKMAGVRCGAYIRTTLNQDGSFNAESGHSIIVLEYNPSSITILEGNADRNGLVRVVTRGWQELSNLIFSSRGRVLCHVIQPKLEYYQRLVTLPCRFCGEIHTGPFAWLISFFHNLFAVFQ